MYRVAKEWRRFQTFSIRMTEDAPLELLVLVNVGFEDCVCVKCVRIELLATEQGDLPVGIGDASGGSERKWAHRARLLTLMNSTK